MSYVEIKYALNSSIGTKQFVPLDQQHGRAVFTEDGIFELKEDVMYFITAIAAGGDGGSYTDGSSSSQQKGGNGGNSGQYALNVGFFIDKRQEVSITVGEGNTIIGNLLTLVKGNGIVGSVGGRSQDGGSYATTYYLAGNGANGIVTIGVDPTGPPSTPANQGESYQKRGNEQLGNASVVNSVISDPSYPLTGHATSGTSPHATSLGGLGGVGYGAGGGGASYSSGRNYGEQKGLPGKGASGIVIIKW